MSEELDDYDDEIDKIFTEINKGINGLKKLNDSDRENVRIRQSRNHMSLMFSV
jgi:hypothetical protein